MYICMCVMNFSVTCLTENKLGYITAVVIIQSMEKWTFVL